MANNYTQFSFIAVKDLTPSERKWWVDNSSYSIIEEAGFPHPFGDECVGFEVELNHSDAIIYSEESGNVDQVADICQMFLREFRCDESITFEWANTCSKPRPGEFGGGSVVITDTKQYWMLPSVQANRIMSSNGDVTFADMVSVTENPYPED